ncbi:hypothetical protein ACFQ1S_46855, partial [Kibdelosporangium lantanae]
MVLDLNAKSELARLVTELAVVHGKVTLSSGKEADYYVDLRRADAHLLAIESATAGRHAIYNLGNGTGFSVRQVI